MKALLISSLREIKQTKARFFSLVGIILLGVAFFVGLGATGPDMLATVDQYYRKYHLADSQVTSNLGLTAEDVALFASADTVKAAEGIKFTDIHLQEKNEVVRLFGYHEEQQLNQYHIVKGRLPQKSGEIVLDNRLNLKKISEIGDKLVIAPEDDSSGSLQVHEFEVVGFVNSPMYIEHNDRGNTSVGSGSVNYFGVVAEADFSSSEFTSIILQYKNMGAATTYSDHYQQQLVKQQTLMEQLAAQRPQERLVEVKTASKKTIENGKKEIADGEAKLAESKKQLEEARKKLEKGQSDLTTAQNELDQKIAEGQSQLSASENELAVQQQNLTSQQQTLAVQKQNLQARAGEAEAGRSRLNELAASRNEAQARLNQLQGASGTIASAISQGEYYINLPDEEFEAVAQEAVAQVNGALTQLPPEVSSAAQGFVAAPTKDGLRSGLNALYGLAGEVSSQAGQVQGGINSLEAAMNTIRYQVQQYDSGLAQISSGEGQLAYAQQQITEGQQQLESARVQLVLARVEGQGKIDQNQQELTKKTAEYEKQEKTYQTQKQESQKKLDQAKTQIDQLEEQLAELKAEDYVFAKRDVYPGYSGYEENAQRISSLATVFPMIFFLIAALVSLTTMSRMVEEKRLEIGTFKALGYSNGAISVKFLLYSVLASGLGIGLGLILGFYLFPTIIFSAYKQLYNITGFVTPWYGEHSLIAFAISFACTVGAAVAVLRLDLASSPSKLLRPKVPKNGKRILIEYLQPLWRRMNFTQKVTLRNLFRYKQRMLMMILGIAGCMAMIITGFGLRDSISDIVTIQFDKIWHYQGIVTFASNAKKENLTDYYQQLAETGAFQDCMRLSSSTFEYAAANEKGQTVTVYAPESPAEIDNFLLFNDRVTGAAYQLADQGALINEKLAVHYDLAVNDTITLKNSEEQLFQLKVAGIVENYTGHFAFVSPTYYQTVFEETPKYNSEFLLFAKELSAKQEDQLANTLMTDKQVVNVSFLSQSRNALDETINSLNLVVWVLIVSAGALAFIVLYNLTNINVSERIRELSTIKVLGFYDQELMMYVYRENILLTLAGILLGIFAGRIEHQYILKTLEVDKLMFSPDLHATSYLYAAAITLFFTAVVGGIMYFKLRKVNMIEALKSNE